jgi:hypothetical protein
MDFKPEFKKAVSILMDMLKEREELEVKIAKQRRTVTALSELAQVPVDAPLGLGGLTQACRTALRALSGKWVTVTDVQAQLETIGFDTAKYEAVLASIATTLRRLVQSGDVAFQKNEKGAVYQWAGPNYGASSSLANLMADFDRDRALRQQKKVSAPSFKKLTK